MFHLTAAEGAQLTKRKRITQDTWGARLDPGSIWISIPELPPSLNVWSRKHWSARSREIARLTTDLTRLRMAYRIPCIARPRVQLVYYFADKRRRDPDNYTPKHLLDGLRHAGIIADDNVEVLQLPQPEFKVDRDQPRTEIFITEWRSET
jgi:Holliday junction resolvase RusA-like endonuclease